jgi:putative NADH-flavin reductase
MKVVVFGATGGVGRHLVTQALAEGHHVTAASRSAGKLAITHERLRTIVCDVLGATAVEGAVAGQDVVFCALGATSKGPVSLYSKGAETVLRAMQAQKVPRLVFLSNFGILGERAADLRGRVLLFLLRRVIRHTLADHLRALEQIRATDVDAVVVRPMTLTDGPLTGQYRVAEDGLPAAGWRISRADVAHFMLRQARAGEFLHRVPAIAY